MIVVYHLFLNLYFEKFKTLFILAFLMDRNKTLILAIVLVVLLFISGVGILAVYSVFYPEEQAYEQQPTVIINNYVTKDEQPAQARASSQQPSYQDMQTRQPEVTYINVQPQGYSYPMYPSYRRSPRYYYPYPYSYPYSYHPSSIYASDAYYPYYGYKRPYSSSKRIYY